MVYKWYILPIGGLYGTYQLLREPETAIEIIHDQLKGAVNWVKDSKEIGQDFRQPQDFSQIVLSPKNSVGPVGFEKKSTMPSCGSTTQL